MCTHVYTCTTGTGIFNVPNFYFFSLFFQSSSGQSTYVQSSCCNPWLDSAWWVNSLHRSQNKSPTQSKQHTANKKSVFMFSSTVKKVNNQNKTPKSTQKLKTFVPLHVVVQKEHLTIRGIVADFTHRWPHRHIDVWVSFFRQHVVTFKTIVAWCTVNVTVIKWK